MAQHNIRDWLTTIGLAQYADLFEASDIDFELLPKLGEAHLELLGVRSLGHRAAHLGARCATRNVAASSISVASRAPSGNATDRACRRARSARRHVL